MIRLAKWYWQTLFAGPRPANLPRPIPFGQGFPGGIECIVIDGERWFYGFNSWGEGYIVTPLIDDPNVMAAFASWYMRPYDNDKREEPAYWREAVDRAIDGTEPSHMGSGPFSTDDFRRIAASLKQAAADSRPITRFTIPEDLLALLAVARGFERPSDMSANVSMHAKLGLSETDHDATNGYLVADMLAGREPLVPGATYADAATFLRGYLADMVNRAPANWKTTFQELIAP
jgi:hypothetical protein